MSPGVTVRTTKTTTTKTSGVVLRMSCSYMMHHSPIFWGKVVMDKMAIIDAFGPVFNKWPMHRLHSG